METRTKFDSLMYVRKLIIGNISIFNKTLYVMVSQERETKKKL